MNQQHETSNGNQASGDGNESRRHRGRRWVKAGMAVAIVGALAVAGVGYAKSDGCFGHFGMHGKMSQAMMSEHIDHMVNHMLADGTAEQKAKVSAIAKSAMNDLRPLHEQHRAAHEQAVNLLTQPTIDRAALEKVRETEMQLADQASKRITQAVEDAADVLTPAQRLKLADHLKKRMG